MGAPAGRQIDQEPRSRRTPASEVRNQRLCRNKPIGDTCRTAPFQNQLITAALRKVLKRLH